MTGSSLASTGLALLSGLSAAAPDLLGWIAQAVLYGTVLALATGLLLKLIGRRLSPTCHGALWLLVLAKFLLPVGPAWEYSLADAARRGATWATALLAPAPSRPVMLLAAPSDEYVVELPREALHAVAAAPDPAWMSVLASAAGVAYCLGLAAAAVIRLRRYRRFAATCRGLPDAPPHITALAHRLCRRLGMRRMPVVSVSTAATAPFVLGLRRPQLVLSPRQMNSMAELEAVVLHEVAHLRRGDLWIRCLQWTAGTLLYFWPVVAWVNRRIDLAREHACDAWALRHGRLSAVEYARCLLGALQPGKSARAGYAPAAMAANVQLVERRIEMILNDTPFVSRIGWRSAPAIALVAAWAAFALSGAATAEPVRPAKPAEIDAPKTETAIMHAQVVGGDGQAKDLVIEAIGTPGQIVQLTGEADGSGGPIMLRMTRDDAEMKSFLAEHPVADADGDGTLTPIERDGYLVARATRDSAAFIKQFPMADTNSDGALSADEVTRAIHGDHFNQIIRVNKGDGAAPKVMMMQAGATATTTVDGKPMNVQVEVDDANPDAAPKILINGEEINPDEHDNVHVFVQKAGDGEQTPCNIAEAWHAGVGEGVTTWLLANGGEPTAEQVSGGVALIQSNADSMLSKLHPGIDADGDGTITKEERAAFHSRQASHFHAKMLESHPDADGNGDGVLSAEEARTYFQEKATKSGGTMIWRERKPAADGGATIVEVRKPAAE